MAISKLPTSASLKEVMDKFEELSLQDFVKGFDVEVRSDLPNEAKEGKIVVINNKSLKVYFTTKRNNVPLNSIGIIYSSYGSNYNLSLDFKKTEIELPLVYAVLNTNNSFSYLEAYLRKNGKWEKFSPNITYIYSPPNIKAGITDISNWVLKSSSSPGVNPKFEVSGNSLLFSSYNESSNHGVKIERRFDQLIDVTNFNTLRIVASAEPTGGGSVYAPGSCGLTNDKNKVDSFIVKATPTSTDRVEFNLDVSNLIGQYYFSVCNASTGTGRGAISKIRIYTIELI